ncbi:MAG: flavodoxin family protein [Xanthobacteraceae bacterium]
MGASRMLVVFYSRSGKTRRVAEALAEALKCDLEEITEPKPRTGFLGYLRSLLEARRKRPSIIAPNKHDVLSYDLVVIGTPVWAWSLSSPVRAYLMTTAGQLPDVAFFCTLGGKGSESTFCADDGRCRQAASRCLRDYRTGSVVAKTFRPAFGV